jgi:hypothetical protein
MISFVIRFFLYQYYFFLKKRYSIVNIQEEKNHSVLVVFRKKKEKKRGFLYPAHTNDERNDPEYKTPDSKPSYSQSKVLNSGVLIGSSYYSRLQSH